MTDFNPEVIAYCREFDIPKEYFFEILHDQKVIPMIRGKAMEYNAFLVLKSKLNSRIWDVQKLNLPAQPGSPDEDVSITHRKSGFILKVESKSCVRGSINSGRRTKIFKEPHCKVKCHRSRSNLSLAATSNDRYSVDSFDLIVTNLENALYQGKTIGEHFELIDDQELIEVLCRHYSVSEPVEIISAARNDWRFVVPSEIAENGFIPRTPYMLLKNDPHWLSFDHLEEKLDEIVQDKWKKRSKSKR